jgi:CelD/BcsL family acetyltransferase involved in cellulose biosynthesis
LRIVSHRNIPEDSSLHRRWNELVLQVERPEVFYTSEWALAMQASYGASLNPLLLLGYDGEDVVGVASLAKDSSERNITFLAANTGDYCEFLSHPSRRTEFVEGVFAELVKLKPKSMQLANLPADSATSNALRQASAKYGFHFYARPAYLCAQADLGSGEKRQRLKASLATKKKLRRYLREMEREGSVKFVHLQSWGEIQSALPQFADAHVARFGETGRTSSLATPARRRFLEELARRFSDSGVVTLSELLVNDQPVAWNYGFQFHGSWFWYQPTFDSRWEEQSPGYCLLARIVMDACDQEDMNRVDLGLGAEGYKERFGNSARQTLYITATRSWPGHLKEITRYRAASLLSRSPRVESVVRGVLSRIGVVRGNQR